MRYVGLDWGSKRIGIAISDPDGKISIPFKIVKKEALGGELANLKQMLGEFEIVLGFPARTDGVSGSSEEEVLKFKLELENLGFKVNLWKEWFSSTEAEKTMKFHKIKLRKKKNLVDKIAASLVLEAFLRSTRNK
ncbi:MAG: Holliday junction resolvase RuvX [Synergistetes bacterium]|nr:Holliday junction resolvase RuvX [Synergistota bacterium]MCX8128237.1 Holliday junction resolvase RuvX [Synergistota bacterium]MDW8192684.1 Holliday junction resolvase RuvX [Synergistota bacterium]